MKIVKRVLPVLLIALALAGCDLLKKALTKGIAHTASRINSIQAVGASKEFAFVDIEYVFTGTGVADERAVFSREGSDARDTVEIELQGTIYTDVDTLTPNTRYTYTLWLLDGEDLEEYDEVTVKTLPVIEIVTPADNLTADAVELTWKKLTYEGEDYLTYEVAIYDGEGIDLADLDLEALLELTDPVEDPTEVVLDASDTEGSHTFGVSPPALAKAYVVKVTTKRGIGDKLSNKSTAIKPFLWLE
ncbi:hypothetical protein CEE36_09735 [candidate division TA06 bacterium B3_TA06]|uniref:Uncharacterized protein n=1 Tax=candidate division TA06 bacterium B3_TA06 TaxID=2012487 RepID=A0A532UZ41_UNCT6|nr:MAG: hypothetical protein CEE36_09735 [candidate division TA06 bacterium B3_TA06]